MRSIKTDVGIINDVSSYNIPESITITRKNTLSLTKNVSEDVYTLSYIKQVINSVGVIGSISNDNLKLNYKIVGRREGDITAAFADTTIANKELNWKTEKSLDEALESAWRWQLEQD